MGQKQKQLTPTESLLDYFGAQLRALREQAGVLPAELAGRLYIGPDLLRKVEVGERYPSAEFIERADDMLGAGGLLRGLGPLLAREQAFRARTGSTPLKFRPELNDAIVLDWMLMDVAWESAREDDSETSESMLAELRQADHVRGAGATYPKLLAHLGADFEAFALRTPRTAIGVLELAAYNAVDLGADSAAQRHYHKALHIALRTGQRRHGAHLIASLAYLTMQCGHPRSAARLAQAALTGVGDRTTPVEGAVWWMIKARSHAKMQEREECVKALGRAEDQLTREPSGGEVELISYFGLADLADERAHCFFDLGDFANARDEAAKALELLNLDRVRRRVIDSALHASGLTRTGDLEQAGMVARQAIGDSGTLRSFRASQALAEMLAELLPHQNVGVVKDVFEFARSAAPVTPSFPSSDARS
ncbi:helix-turn-helix domain-containing protein [Glycomyces sp. L485]|uniref:helix-turn-helix domain-containing protein n=1 Tax=Glycomyces sp. L485 TaxID=2909235 RepID=UPI001F4B6DE5|nr:helix-turn-helix transcriptional regulator [Glycomyces sp. L485]MCH7229917.1 helix-turn-helix domain-containing protein [Glycomyces sp. L485]